MGDLILDKQLSALKICIEGKGEKNEVSFCKCLSDTKKEGSPGMTGNWGCGEGCGRGGLVEEADSGVSPQPAVGRGAGRLWLLS